MSLKEPLHDAQQVVVNPLKPVAERATATDILATLKMEHDEIKELLSTLQDAETSGLRHGLVQRLTAALVAHSVAEEKVVYEAVIALSDQQARMDGYEGVLEHKWAARTLARLAAMDDATSAEHKATARVLKELVELHIEEEEHNIWRDVRKHYSNGERARMNILYLTEKCRTKVPSAL
jgi:hemerythrin superfamily protein